MSSRELSNLFSIRSIVVSSCLGLTLLRWSFHEMVPCSRSNLKSNFANAFDGPALSLRISIPFGSFGEACQLWEATPARSARMCLKCRSVCCYPRVLLHSCLICFSRAVCASQFARARCLFWPASVAAFAVALVVLLQLPECFQPLFGSVLFSFLPVWVEVSCDSCFTKWRLAAETIQNVFR